MLWLACTCCQARANPLDQWTLIHPRPTQEDLNKAVFANNLYFALGASGSIFVSQSGNNWTVAAANLGGSLHGLVFGNGRFVAVGTMDASLEKTNSTFSTVSGDGLTWTAPVRRPGGDFRSLAFGAGTFVAVGTDALGGAAWTSQDGQQWTRQTVPGADSLASVAYADGEFVAVGGKSIPFNHFESLAWAYSSTNGVNWTLLTNAVGFTYTSVAAGADRFVAVGSGPSSYPGPPAGPSGVTVFEPSTNSTWKIQSGNLGARGTVTYGNGVFVSNVGISTNGLSWTGVPFRSDVVFGLGSAYFPGVSVAFGNGKWIGVGSLGVIGVSTNLSDWTFPGLRTGLPLLDLCRDDNLSVAVGGRDSKSSGWPARGVLMTSSNSQDWIVRVGDSIPTRPTLHSVVCASGLYVAVGGDPEVDNTGVLLVSTNGTDWTERAFSPRTPLAKVIYGNGLFVAVGGLLFFTSTNVTGALQFSDSAIDANQRFYRASVISPRGPGN